MPLDPVPANQKPQRKKHTGLGATAIIGGLVGLTCVGTIGYYAFSGGSAVSVSDLRSPRQAGTFVVDRSGVLKPVAAEINRVSTEIRQRTGSEIIVVTVPKTKGTPKTFAQKAYRTWRVGGPSGDGMIVLLVTGSKRRLEFEVGPGMQRRGVTYQNLQNMADASMLPTLRSGNITQATVEGVREIAGMVGSAQAAANMPRHVGAYRSYYVGGWSMGASMLYLILIVGGLIVLSSFGWGVCYVGGYGWYGPSYWYGPGVYMDGGVYVDGGYGGGYVDGGYGGGYDGGYGGGDCSSDCSSDCGGGDF